MSNPWESSPKLSINKIVNSHSYKYFIEKLDNGIDMLDSLGSANISELQEKDELEPGQLRRIANYVYGGNYQVNQIDDKAYFGFMKDFIEALSKETEASPVAIYLQFLIAFGNAAGRRSYIATGATPHFPNEYLLIVGNTSKARKGTSWDFVRRIFKDFEVDWDYKNIKSGVVSGEGIVHHIRDANMNLKEPDLGVDDKRMLIMESEYASILKVMKRESNTVSPVIRDAWDGKPLGTLAKNTPTKCLAPHVSIIGHITENEFKKYLTGTEIANGFINRYLIAKIARHQLLPEGGLYDCIDLSPFREPLQNAFNFIKTEQRLIKSKRAIEYWASIYSDLGRDKDGIIGAITARSEAHVLRLSMILALLSSTPSIEPEHIESALMIWKYCEGSCIDLFSETGKETRVDKVYKALVKAPEGLTRTQIIHEVLNRNVNKMHLNQIKEELLEKTMIYVSWDNKIETWRAI